MNSTCKIISIGVVAAWLWSACEKPGDPQRVAENTSGSIDGAIHDTCNGPSNFIADDVTYELIEDAGDSLLWISGRNATGKIELGVYLPWPATTGFQSDYEVYYDPNYEPDSLDNKNDRLKSAYFGVVPDGVEVTALNLSGTGGVENINVVISEVQVYRVNPSGPGVLKCVDHTAIEVR